MPHCACDRNIRQLLAGMGASQHQAAAAHVATPYELDWKEQALAKNSHQRLDVLRRSDAAEQHNFAFWSGLFANRACVTLKRLAVAAVSGADRGRRNRCEVFGGDHRLGWNQAAGRGNHECSRDSISRFGKPLRVGKFPTKIEAADETEYFAERRSFAS